MTRLNLRDPEGHALHSGVPPKRCKRPADNELGMSCCGTSPAALDGNNSPQEPRAAIGGPQGSDPFLKPLGD